MTSAIVIARKMANSRSRFSTSETPAAFTRKKWPNRCNRGWISGRSRAGTNWCIKTQGTSTRLTFTGAPLPEKTATDGDDGFRRQRAGQAVLRGLQNWFQGIAPLPVVPGDK